MFLLALNLLHILNMTRGDIMDSWTSNYYLYNVIRNFIDENPTFTIINIIQFCLDRGWRVIKYDNSMTELVDISIDGFSHYDDNRYTIFYNSDMPVYRIRFTIAHEIGHIMLYHHFLIPSKILMASVDKKTIWEYQADTFAQNILFPVDFANRLKRQNPYSISRVMRLSKPMIDVRYRRLKTILQLSR